MHFHKILLVTHTLTGRNRGVKRSFRCFDFNVVTRYEFILWAPSCLLVSCIQAGAGAGCKPGRSWWGCIKVKVKSLQVNIQAFKDVSPVIEVKWTNKYYQGWAVVTQRGWTQKHLIPCVNHPVLKLMCVPKCPFVSICEPSHTMFCWKGSHCTLAKTWKTNDIRICIRLIFSNRVYWYTFFF